MTFQLKDKHYPYMMGQHCMAHRTNLIVQALLNLPMVLELEDLLQSYMLTFLPPLSVTWNSLSLPRSHKQEDLKF
jgi:hypothetical protein